MSFLSSGSGAVTVRASSIMRGSNLYSASEPSTHGQEWISLSNVNGVVCFFLREMPYLAVVGGLAASTIA